MLPTTFVLFGMTGDLVRKKILPALYDLWATGRLANTRIVGFSRRPFSTEEIRRFAAEVLPQGFDRNFLDSVTYVEGQFDDPTAYERLSEYLEELDQKEHGGCSNKLFYLSVPPTLYRTITEHLSSSGLSVPCGGEDGFARILIEKPFGKDLVTARELDFSLGRLFREEQIYRIDHYLAKDSLFKIAHLHRQDDALRKRWNREHIARVEISLFEKGVVGSRGVFYDGVGALRDVGQNHVLQMMALSAMKIEDLSDPRAIQAARAEVLRHLLPYVGEVFRGQYEGYRAEPGVSPASLTETFFRLTAFLDTEEFRGVPFVLSAGKGLCKNLTEVTVRFKDGMKIVFDVPPEDSMPAYQKILLDCVAGDQTVFISTEEIMAEWEFITPIVKATENLEPVPYPLGADPDNLR